MTKIPSKEPLVSIIVPVYNVESFLRKSVDSLLAQTYKNIEIILINDGSTDTCGTMCDEYSGRYNQIRVIHQKNGGLSAARNTGIDMAKGDFLYFADSDDFIATDSIEYLVNMIDSFKSDIAIASYQLVDENAETNSVYTHSDYMPPVNMNAKSALEDALYERKTKFHAWGKLYRKELFNEIRYPEGKLFEDVGTTYKIYLKSNSISVSEAQKYFYTVRKGSITQSSYNPKMMDLIDFAEDINRISLHMEHEDIRAASDAYLFMSAINIIEVINKSNGKSNYAEDYSRCMSIVRRLRWHISTNKDAPMRVRLYAISALPGRSIFAGILKAKNYIINQGK